MSELNMRCEKLLEKLPGSIWLNPLLNKKEVEVDELGSNANKHLKQSAILTRMRKFSLKLL